MQLLNSYFITTVAMQLTSQASSIEFSFSNTKLYYFAMKYFEKYISNQKCQYQEKYLSVKIYLEKVFYKLEQFLSQMEKMSQKLNKIS